MVAADRKMRSLLDEIGNAEIIVILGQNMVPQCIQIRFSYALVSVLNQIVIRNIVDIVVVYQLIVFDIIDFGLLRFDLCFKASEKDQLIAILVVKRDRRLIAGKIVSIGLTEVFFNIADQNPAVTREKPRGSPVIAR